MKKTLSNFYLITTTLFLVAIVVSILILLTNFQKEFLNLSTKDIRANIINSYKAELKNKVEIMEQMVNERIALNDEILKKNIQSKVEEAYTIANALYEKNKDTKSKEEIQKLIIDTLRDIRFNNQRGYYFIDDMDAICKLYPIATELEGKSLYDTQDINGKYVIRSFLDVVKEHGAGFSVYYSGKYKSQFNKKFKKIAYVKKFEPYDWIIGTGEYLKDVENDTKNEIALIVNSINKSKSDSYIMIAEIHDYNGGENFASEVLSKDDYGIYKKSMSFFAKDEKGRRYQEDILKLLNKDAEGFVTFYEKKANSNEAVQKLIYVKKLKHWNWVLSSGTYMDKLDQIVEENIIKTKNLQKKMKINTFILLGVVFILLLFISLFLSKKISFEIKNIIEFFKRAAFDKEMIDIDKFKIDDFKFIAKYANEMLENIDDQQEKLKKINNELGQRVDEKTKELKITNTFLAEKNKLLEENYFSDSLTKLGNRNKFLNDISDFEEVSIMILDIDGFKNINDYYGTKTGDKLLVAVSRMIKSFSLKHKANTYRLSSDEFLLVWEKEYKEKELFELYAEFEKEFSEKEFYDISNKNRLSVGLTCAFSNERKGILGKVDIALNYAKKNKLSYAIYDENNPHMNTHKHNIYWREKIQWAIDNSLIEPYFQRIVNLSDKTEKKYETLMRLVDENEVISPYMFLEVSKDTKQYPYLSRMIIEKAFKRFAGTDIVFSINISMLDIENEETMEFLKQMIKAYNFGEQLILEILESEEIVDNEKFLDFVNEMRKFNIRFALDDFGSGYSNFAFLLKMHPKFLKIDGSLIKNITKDVNSKNIVKTIISFAKQMDSIVIAEFVENEEIVEVLQTLGINYMQGYHFHTPSADIDV